MIKYDPRSAEELNEDVVILAAVRTCKLDANDDILKEAKLDFHLYSSLGPLNVVDITCLQSVVGRVKDGNRGWAIIDRSGSLARATSLPGDDD